MPPRRKPRKRQPKKEEPKPLKKPRGSRKKVTSDSLLEKIDELLEVLDKEIERKSKEREKGTRTFQSIRKTVRDIRKDIPRLANGKRRVKNTGKRTSPFMVKHPITEECAKFLQLEKGTLLSRTEVTNAICVYSHYDLADNRDQMKKWAYLNPKGERNLQKEGHKMTIVPDKTLNKLLRYDEYRKQVDSGKVTKKTKDKETGEIVEEVLKDSALYYWVIQKRIGRLFEK